MSKEKKSNAVDQAVDEKLQRVAQALGSQELIKDLYDLFNLEDSCYIEGTNVAFKQGFSTGISLAEPTGIAKDLSAIGAEFWARKEVLSRVRNVCNTLSVKLSPKEEKAKKAPKSYK